MKPEEKDLDEVVKRYWSSASQEEAAADCDRVLHHLRAAAEHAPQERRAGSRILPIFGTRFAMVSAAAAVLLAVVLGTTIVPRYRSVAVVEKSGAAVSMGEILRADADGNTLVLTDGSRVEMRAQSELVLERANDGVRIRLNNGDVIVSAAKQHGHLYVQTRDMTVSVVGTVFLVKAEETGSRVAVIEGEVHVKQGEKEQKLKPGDQVKTNPLMESQPVSQEIAWSSRAPEHMALLQQSVVPASAREAFDLVSIRPSTVPVTSGERGGKKAFGGGGGQRNQRGVDSCSGGAEPVLDPQHFDAANVTVFQLVLWANGLNCQLFRGSDVVFGGPEWIRRDGYDVLATFPDGTPGYTRTQLKNDKAPKLKRMLQAMLADRFKLDVHHEMRELSVYILSVASGGPKFTRSRSANPNAAEPANGVVIPGGLRRGEGPSTVNPEFSVWKEGDNPCCNGSSPASIDGRKQPFTYLTTLLGYFSGRPVLDRTGLTGEYNFFLNFAPLDTPGAPPMRAEPGGELPTQSIFDVLKQVGLELKAAKEKVDVLVIDRVERPTEN